MWFPTIARVGLIPTPSVLDDEFGPLLHSTAKMIS